MPILSQILGKSKATKPNIPHPPIEPAEMVQSYGMLLSLSSPDLTILQVSQNSQTFLGSAPQDLVGQNWAELTGSQTIPQSLNLFTPLGPRQFDCLSYQSATHWLIELEPATTPATITLLRQVSLAMTQIQSQPNLESFYQQVLQETQTVLGLERIHIYRFDSMAAGEVIAERKPPDLPSYLGLHFPATDIPEPVRQFYLTAKARYVADVTAPLVPLYPSQDPCTHRPLDLTPITLRGVDPCCVTYHHNMGIRAFFVMPLIVDEQLWGLLACHHRQPLYCDQARRSAGVLLAQFVGSELANRLRQRDLAAREQLRSTHAELLTAIAQAKDFRAALVEPQPRMLGLVNAHGAAVCLGGDITLVGKTPQPQQLLALLEWVTPQIQASLYVTDCLPQHYSNALAFRDNATGILVLQISQRMGYYILWFRPEVKQTINWAGNPAEVLSTNTIGEITLCPRASFDLWQETVELTALPWQSAEVQSALDLRNAIVGIVLTKADELAHINLELAQKNQELESFAFAASHDLQEPLRGIYNFAHLLIKNSSQALDDEGRRRLHTMMRLTRRMEYLIEALLRFSRLGQTELKLQPVDLNDILERVIEVIYSSRPDPVPQITIPQPLPTLTCDAILVTEVFTNLLSNACKYTDQPPAQIEIGIQLAPIASVPSVPIPPVPILYVKDQGIGIRPRHLDRIFQLFKRLHEQDLYGGGTGVGLTITRKIVEQHGGKIWVESVHGQGTTFFFTLAPS